VFSWTGFYIGGNVGAGWGRGDINDTVGLMNFATSNNASFIGGGQIGGNYQIGAFVIGAEADLIGSSITAIRGSVFFFRRSAKQYG
jgi:outer membrane immunogenic protein